MIPAVLTLNVLSGSILTGTSLLYAALGEVIGEKAGVVNLGVEGLMLMGASVGFAVTATTGDPYLRVLAAALAGGVTNLLFAYVVISRRANQLASGLALMFFGAGVSALIGGPYVGNIITGLPPLAVPWLTELSWTRGTTLFRYDLLVYLAVPISFLVHWSLHGTRWGLGVRAIGEDPGVAFAAGKRLQLVRYQALFVAGVLTAAGGAHLSVALALNWTEGMTGGRGFIAIALVIFSNWNPRWLVAGAVLFGGAEALQLQLQARGSDVSPFLMNMTPYLLTLAVLVVWGRNQRSAAPAWLGRTYYGSE